MPAACAERMLDALYLRLLSDRRRSVPGLNGASDFDRVADVHDRDGVLLCCGKRPEEYLYGGETRRGFRLQQIRRER